MKFVPPTAEDQDVFRLLKSEVIELNTQRDAEVMATWQSDRAGRLGQKTNPKYSAEIDCAEQGIPIHPDDM